MKLYRLLLHLYPSSYRADYGDEMTADFEQELGLIYDSSLMADAAKGMAGVLATIAFAAPKIPLLANAAGLGTSTYNISRATRGYRVNVSVTVVKGSQHASCATYFTPR